VIARLDVVTLLRALDEVEGHRFLGAVASGECVELVFDGEHGRNLVSMYVIGRQAGTTVLGGVATPETYVRSCSRWRPWGVRP
jgi:hypothetical protein